MDAIGIFNAAVDAVRPGRLVDRFFDAHPLDRPVGRTFVVGTGKASMAMAGAVEQALVDHEIQGLVAVPHDYVDAYPSDLPTPNRIEVIEAGHPVPDQSGIDAANRTLALASSATRSDHLLVLISGGGSALWSTPLPPLTLADLSETYTLMLRSGAPIADFNAVRKHLSRISGGRLAAAAGSTPTTTLVISDVPGDDLSTIASGPTVPDPTTFDQARTVMERADVWDQAPPPVRDLIQAGCEGRIPETPDRTDPAFANCLTHLVGTNSTALDAAEIEAVRLGYTVLRESKPVTGEARVVGQDLAQRLRSFGDDVPVCILQGGETTVTVTGQGVGGRNQELALAAGIALEGAPEGLLVLSGGTDGRDGPTEAAGALAGPSMASLSREAGLDPKDVLRRNDSNTLLGAIDHLVITGPTHTNVMDIQIGLVSRLSGR